MSSSPNGSTTPFSDYASSRLSHRPPDDSRIIEVYILKNTTSDPILVLVPLLRAETYLAFWDLIKNDLYPPGTPGAPTDPEEPMVFLLDPYMTRLRLDLWDDLLPSLRGKRLLVLPADAALDEAKSPIAAAAAAAAAAQPRRNPWTSLFPKSTPTTPETSIINVDALSQPERKKALPQSPPPPPPAQAPSRPKLRAEDRSVSFFSTPEFAFDIALWCRFAPSYRPGMLMHFQFREIVVQVVPTARGLQVGSFRAKAASALTNMLRRQGCLGARPAEEMVVRGEQLRFALEGWPSDSEGLGLPEETLGCIVEPVLLFCEIGEVYFPGREGKGRDGRGGREGWEREKDAREKDARERDGREGRERWEGEKDTRERSGRGGRGGGRGGAVPKMQRKVPMRKVEIESASEEELE